jgi:hypothetical protein
MLCEWAGERYAKAFGILRLRRLLKNAARRAVLKGKKGPAPIFILITNFPSGYTKIGAGGSVSGFYK